MSREVEVVLTKAQEELMDNLFSYVEMVQEDNMCKEEGLEMVDINIDNYRELLGSMFFFGIISQTEYEREMKSSTDFVIRVHRDIREA